MDVKEIKELIPKDYVKQANRDLTVFTSSIFGETYVRLFKELFGVDYSSIFFVVRKGNLMTFYRSEKDHQNHRKGFGEKLKDKEFASLVVKKLRKFTDLINEFISKNDNLNKFLENKEEFVDNYREFFAYHQVVYWGGDYLAENYPELEQIESLKEVYAYNERVIPDVENYLVKLGIDHLKYDQSEGEFREIGLFFFNNHEKVSLFGDDLEEIESYIKSLSKIDVNLKELKGISVSKGKITGRVQVIKDPNKLNQAKEGFILVTGMTRPQFNNILRKCKGIIADEGNVLSHASILAREFGIPCIVRTKIATEILKDNDLVELDADNGVVRKI